MSTWEAKTWYALLCRIDLEPQEVSARTDSIYENPKWVERVWPWERSPDPNDFDPSPLATMSTWETKTRCALLCRIDLEPLEVSARTDLIYEIRIVLWAYKQ